MTWEQRIEKAIQEGKFTNEDRLRSMQWRNCAVSELGLIEVNASGSIIAYNILNEDIEARIVYHLGCRFGSAVVAQKPEQAKEIYNELKEYVI